MTPRLMLALAHDISNVLERRDIDGIVVTHGPDTVKETAFLVDLVVRSEKPIVFVASMRNLSETGGDGPRNLLDAFRVAASHDSHGRGAAVVVNETIHSGRYVTKMNTVNPATFESPNFGPMGIVSGGFVRYLHQPVHGITLPDAAIDENVHLIKCVTGMDDRMIRMAIESGATGIVLEGSGAGNIPSAMVPGVLAAISAGIPVVITSRALWGFLSPTYGTGKQSGGGFDLVGIGVIPAQHLPSQKARIKLMVALVQSAGEIDLKSFFETP